MLVIRSEGTADGESSEGGEEKEKRTAGDELRVYLGGARSGGAPLSPLAGYDCASVYASSILMAQITYAACVAGEELLCPCATCCLCVVTAA
ncbi:hypothetical protein Q8A67_000790 [Cirrhinus molitorella]|uniref:Uncharacterized protein n=1 Tax=Cirrhinus molitorella TaxID=172907 RepID=A0AA88QAB7_9TELE|nr:hypothetical protein Q8A67_000790 [Cirrhinus molitorella]